MQRLKGESVGQSVENHFAKVVEAIQLILESTSPAVKTQINDRRLKSAVTELCQKGMARKAWEKLE
jgi:actin-like ATPase involved in cell morphogenesis